ncbi:MAG: signal recognition particle-docking protein FtsY [Deltaproteobacteria bacterium RBG_16_58_17]|nr:MAG: signal recognition particle-docking protein FtsY [Deltaproteobacteria bacterium RBG_16_58_17]OHE17410.1 MAG: signal recognition particle-docking protein FtsY [Syntrophobacterales bacterium GWC2_56_13]OHE21728.1 MAG: signal recognition particle-docking protein FtsY [Syntrophobacterales bacterium GWF2_56_9]
MGQDNDNKGFFDRLKAGLAKTRKLLLTDVDDIILGSKEIDRALFEELEEALIVADVGPAFTGELIESLKEKVRRKELGSPEILRKVLRETMREILLKNEAPLKIPPDQIYTIMVVGVNGTGKTTTIGKLAHQLKGEGHEVMLVAADTFRAAAVEQLEAWAKRAEVPLIRQAPNADPAAVVYDALRSAKAGRPGVVIIDTAGRLHTKVNLMEELKKMRRIMGRELPGAPHEVLLVLDATTGQNAVVQARMFRDEIGVTGLILTKLDGTAKGGVVVRIARELNIPLRYIGVGEQVDDLRPFRAGEFVEALFAQNGR